MVDQTTTKLIKFIKDLRMYVHGIPYIAAFVVLQNIIVDSNYSMLFGRPWVRNVKVPHDWGNNMITIQGNGTIQTIVVTKHLSTNLKRPKVLLCFNYQNGITNEEKK
jgi:hypothetical protein